MAYRRNNYSFVIDSSFQPFSFQELIQPLALYKDAFEKTEAAYSDLQTKANIWDGLASEENDPETYEQYRKYATDLRKQAEDLSKRGLNMVNRSKLMDLKSRYASEIVPIEEAYKTRRAQIEEQRKALLQNPTLLLSRRADMTSLDDYLRNPQLGYESYNGALLTQQVGQAASAIAKSLTDYSNGKPLDGFTRTWLQQHGYSAAEVAQAISNPGSSQSSRVLNAIVDNVVADSRIADWADTSTLNQAYGYARQGLWNAVGQTQVGTYTDEAAKIAAQEASQKRMIEYQLGEAARRSVNHAMLTPRALRSQNEVTRMNDALARYKQLGYIAQDKDDNYVVTAKGMSAYRNPVNAEEVIPGFMDPTEKGVALRGAASFSKESEFKQFLDSQNNGESLERNGYFSTKAANSLITDIANRAKADSYDTYHSTEYVRQLDDTYAKEVKRQVLSEPDVIDKVDFNGKDGFTGEHIDNSDLKDYTPTRINYSRYGNTITWINDKGDVIRTSAPKGVNERVSSTVQEAMNNAAMISAVLREGKIPMSDINGNPILKNGAIQFSDTPLTDEMIAAYYNDWQNEMDIVNSVGSMYVSPSTTKNQEFKPYEFGAGMQNMYYSDDSDE